MATQGLVTVVSRHGGQVLMKIVAGCNGQKAAKVARRLKHRWPISLKNAFSEALLQHFGEKCGLIVIGDESAFFHGGGELLLRFRKTFDQPKFNPRRENGECDHVVVVKVP